MFRVAEDIRICWQVNVIPDVGQRSAASFQSWSCWVTFLSTWISATEQLTSVRQSTYKWMPFQWVDGLWGKLMLFSCIYLTPSGLYFKHCMSSCDTPLWRSLEEVVKFLIGDLYSFLHLAEQSQVLHSRMEKRIWYNIDRISWKLTFTEWGPETVIVSVSSWFASRCMLDQIVLIHFGWPWITRRLVGILRNITNLGKFVTTLDYVI